MPRALACSSVASLGGILLSPPGPREALGERVQGTIASYLGNCLPLLAYFLPTPVHAEDQSLWGLQLEKAALASRNTEAGTAFFP